MDQRQIHEILSGRGKGIAASVLRAILLPLSWVYSFAMRLRRWGYRRGLLPSRSPAVPVISVGNLTTGGTGKTPMVAWIVRLLKSTGADPSILIRGYKSAEGSADEAELLGRLTGVPVAVNPDRVAAAEGAVIAGSDVLVMDDGFQHQRLRRDLDIVLIDATCPFGYGHSLPRGLLREPLSALSDAHAIVITRSDEVEPRCVEDLDTRLRALNQKASLHRAVHRPVSIIDEGNTEIALDSIAGKKTYAFCGVGNPESFFRALSGLDAHLVGRESFDDHVHYTRDVIDALRSDILRTGPEVVVTTQKDATKLPGTDLGCPVWQLRGEISITAGSDELIDKVKAAWSKPQTPHTEP